MINTTKLIIVIFVLILLPSISFSAENIAEKKIKNIEGVYKRTFENMLYDGSGTKFISEDVVEIVRYSPDAIYFRAELSFSNAHYCSIWGIAKYNNDSFIFKSNEKNIGNQIQPCTLKIYTDNKYLTLTDTLTEDSPATCSEYCGARGSRHYFII